MLPIRETVFRTLDNRLLSETAERLAEDLTSDRWTHDYPISVEQARQLGLPISTEVPTEVCQLMNLFSQAGQDRPSVEYIPVPYPPSLRSPGNGKK